MKVLTIMIILISSTQTKALSLSQLRPDNDVSSIQPVKKTAIAKEAPIELTEGDKLEIAKKLNMRHALEGVTYQSPNSHRSHHRPLMSPAFTTGQGLRRN